MVCSGKALHLAGSLARRTMRLRQYPCSVSVVPLGHLAQSVEFVPWYRDSRLMVADISPARRTTDDGWGMLSMPARTGFSSSMAERACHQVACQTVVVAVTAHRASMAGTLVWLSFWASLLSAALLEA